MSNGPHRRHRPRRRPPAPAADLLRLGAEARAILGGCTCGEKRRFVMLQHRPDLSIVGQGHRPGCPMLERVGTA